ncbi:MAG: UDP-N-acetylmuramate--L-alanine ligase [Chloroflexi bacterium]|nr:UDP-N-acetylmuramate--L-alanine ligase [Chloroflexota bacterium]
MTVQPDSPKAHVHFIGIGGSGLSAIARLLLEQGYRVTGSDRTLSPLADELKTAGATVAVGHAAENVTGADWVVRSSAIPDDNPEVVAALAAGIPVYKRADFLGRLMAPPEKDGIAIAGTHGKTTTTAMIAWMLDQLGTDPSFIIGGIAQNFGVNAHAGKGRAFVIEADEYDRMFLGLQPRYSVVTNIELDHPDIYPTLAAFEAAFVDFARLTPENGALIICGEDMGATQLAQTARHMGKRVIGYRIAENQITEAGEWTLARNVTTNNLGGFTFDAITRLQSGSEEVSGIHMQVPGLHNVRNALAALSVAVLMGYDLKDAAQTLSKFKGTGRRFEIKGEASGVIVIDDYAHHPTEIRATLEAARARYPAKHIWAVWQPHTYSRVQTLFNDFAGSFGEADEVVVSEIYAAREPLQSFSAEQVVKAMHHPAAHFIPSLPAIRNHLVSHLKSGDVLIVMSAGDADQVSAEVLAHLKESEIHHA